MKLSVGGAHGDRVALGLARDDPAGHLDFLVEVIAGTDPVVSVCDPKRDPLDEQHR